MTKFVLAPAVLTIALFAQSITADAQARRFFNPDFDRDQLSFCLSDATTCGKPVADNFCKSKGYDTAVLFQRNTATRAQQQIKFADTGEYCSGAQCLTFRQIKCYTPAAS